MLKGVLCVIVKKSLFSVEELVFCKKKLVKKKLVVLDPLSVVDQLL